MKFAEHIHSEVIDDVSHRHTVFTIPKRLRVFFKYDRKLNTILFRAAWGALSQVLGIDERELAAIFTVQTDGEALNYHPHLHGAAHEFDALEFIATLSCHVPKTYESITRYYRRYSCRRRGERAKLSPPPAEETESDYRREFRRSSWAACIKRIYEIDPLESVSRRYPTSCYSRPRLGESRDGCPTCKAQTCPP